MSTPLLLLLCIALATATSFHPQLRVTPTNVVLNTAGTTATLRSLTITAQVRRNRGSIDSTPVVVLVGPLGNHTITSASCGPVNTTSGTCSVTVQLPVSSIYRLETRTDSATSYVGMDVSYIHCTSNNLCSIHTAFDSAAIYHSVAQLTHLLQDVQQTTRAYHEKRDTSSSTKYVTVYVASGQSVANPNVAVRITDNTGYLYTTVYTDNTGYTFATLQVNGTVTSLTATAVYDSAILSIGSYVSGVYTPMPLDNGAGTATLTSQQSVSISCFHNDAYSTPELQATLVAGITFLGNLRPGLPLPKLVVVYPGPVASKAYFNSTDNTLVIGANYALDTFMLYRELAHWFAYSITGTYVNRAFTTYYDCMGSMDSTMQLVEGYSTFAALAMVQTSNGVRTNSTGAVVSNYESYSCTIQGMTFDGGRIAAGLWDLYDYNNDCTNSTTDNTYGRAAYCDNNVNRQISLKTLLVDVMQYAPTSFPKYWSALQTLTTDTDIVALAAATLSYNYASLQQTQITRFVLDCIDCQNPTRGYYNYYYMSASWEASDAVACSLAANTQHVLYSYLPTTGTVTFGVETADYNLAVLTCWKWTSVTATVLYSQASGYPGA